MKNQIEVPELIDKKKINYTLELLWLSQLYSSKLIDDSQYVKIKKAIRDKYNIA